MPDLLNQFADLVLNVNFLWVVIAVTITMEVLKWTIPYFKTADSKLYPIFVLLICGLWTFLKAVIIAESTKEWFANFIFTVLLADVFYTYCGQYIMKGLLFVFRLRFSSQDKIETEPKP